MLKHPRRYHVYLLRFWEECLSPADSVWRFSLEDPLTERRQGFTCLDSLLAYLQAEMNDSAAQQAEKREGV